MREQMGNLFSELCDAVVITTNGFVKNNGSAVMGRGVARMAAASWPELPALLGDAIKKSGNHVMHFRREATVKELITMPVKDNWFEPAKLELIVRSCGELTRLADQFSAWQKICLPRPGCGNGQLCWDHCADGCLGPVKPEIEELLDDRFVVVFEEGH